MQEWLGVFHDLLLEAVVLKLFLMAGLASYLCIGQADILRVKGWRRHFPELAPIFAADVDVSLRLGQGSVSANILRLLPFRSPILKWDGHRGVSFDQWGLEWCGSTGIL